MAINRWLIIPVEVKHREFHARMILSALAAERGLRVLVGKDTMIRRLAPALPRAVIFDKSLGTARHGKPQRFEKLGHKVTVLDEESTGYYGSPEQFLSVRLAKETLDACARWYCISDKLREHVSKLYPEHRDRFEVSGLIRTDSWHKPFHGFYEAERKRIADAHGPFILFNSNFGGIIHARGQAFVDKQIRGQKQAYSDVQNRMAKIFDEGKPNLEAFIALMPKLCEWFPSHRVIVRPHPSETLSFWQETFAGNQQITVSNEGVATPWILASDMLVHHGCTTGIEAAILGKQHVMFAPHPDEHHDTDVMAKIQKPCKSTLRNTWPSLARQKQLPIWSGTSPTSTANLSQKRSSMILNSSHLGQRILPPACPFMSALASGLQTRSYAQTVNRPTLNRNGPAQALRKSINASRLPEPDWD